MHARFAGLLAGDGNATSEYYKRRKLHNQEAAWCPLGAWKEGAV
ncbi:hypothetical protein [Paenibacillus oenotherae]|nr:hypothetical protein [Paenibacillus oenotherae]